MKRKQWIVISLLMLLILTPLISVSAFAKEVMTKEHIFETDTPDFSYDAKRTIKEKGKHYELKEVQYQQLKEKSLAVFRQYQYTGLPAKQVPLDRNFDIDGQTVTLYASGMVQYSEAVETVKEIRSGQQAPANFPEHKNINRDGYTFDAQLIGITQREAKRDFTANVKFTGDRGADFYFNGKNIGKMGVNPTWPGYESDVRTYLNLSAGSRISGGSWSGGFGKEKGKTVRYATFTGTQPVYNDTATYQYKTYSALVTYDNRKGEEDKVYTVKARCLYEPSEVKSPKPEPQVPQPSQPEKGMSLLQKIVLAGAGIVLLATLVVLTLYIIGKKRKKKEMYGSGGGR